MIRKSNATTTKTDKYKVSLQRSDYIAQMSMRSGGDGKLSLKGIERIREWRHNFSIHKYSTLSLNKSHQLVATMIV
jgi:hypothetical protein